jgi:hypothetical protein
VPHVSLARRVPAGFDVTLDPHHGYLVAARSCDTETRTVELLHSFGRTRSARHRSGSAD